MSNDPYSPRVRQLFAEPAHAGALEGAVSAFVDDQGVRIRLFAAVEQGAVARLGFEAWGCPHTIAAAEAFCAGYEGRPVADLASFAARELLEGLPVPVEKTARILVVEDAVRALGRNIGQNDCARSCQNN